MTFDARQEASYIVGETEFYEFDFGSSIERYTSNRRKTVAFGQTWLPLPIRRSGFDDDFSLDPEKMKMVMPAKPSFVGLVTQGGVDAVKLKIIRGFGADYALDYRNPWWVGWLVDISVGINAIEGTLEDARTFFKEEFPRIKHQPLCNNVLYDGVCGIPFGSRLEVRTVTTIAEGGRLLTLSGAIPALADYVTFGRIRKTGTAEFWRHITRQAGTQYVLQTPVVGLVVGDSVDVLPGCDLQGATCISKFANIDNFVGTPYVPKANPVTEGF